MEVPIPVVARVRSTCWAPAHRRRSWRAIDRDLPARIFALNPVFYVNLKPLHTVSPILITRRPVSVVGRGNNDHMEINN